MRPRNALSLLTLSISAVLVGCDGATITIEPNPEQCDTPMPATCYMVKNNTGEWIYDTLSQCDVIPNGAVQDGKGACADEGATVDICDSPEPPPGAPACYAITPDASECPLGDCAVEYRIADFCGVRGEQAEIVEQGYCDGTIQPPAPETLCALINSRTYYTETLEEGGATPHGINKAHWSIHFEDGELSLFQSDFGMAGSYACRDEQMIITVNGGDISEHILTFENGVESFEFNPVGAEPLTYIYGETKRDGDACGRVRGNRYSTPPDPNARPLEGPTFLDFNDSPNSVIFGYGDIREAGHYDCQLGELHVHTQNRIKPLVIEVNRHGTTATILDEHNVTLPIVDDSPVACDQRYNPVCAAFNTGIQCVTTPCPTEVYKTYGNRCHAEADKSAVLFDGECGKLEGEPVGGQSVACPAVYMPACAKHATNTVCITSPCESHEYKTFGNACAAGAALAMTTFEGSCDTYGIEGLVSFQQEPIRLDMPQAAGFEANLVRASIDGNILTATVSYSGCNQQAVHFNASTAGIKASGELIVQAENFFTKDTNDACEAVFTTEQSFDLAPIAAAYFTQFPDRPEGFVNFPGIGTYKF